MLHATLAQRQGMTATVDVQLSGSCTPPSCHLLSDDCCCCACGAVWCGVLRYLAFHFPFITERSMLAHLRAVPWRLDQDAFKAWRQGLTGYPLVDAGVCVSRVGVNC
jgi:hypothetical protein